MPKPSISLALRGTYAWMEGAYRTSDAFVYTNAVGYSGTSRTGSVVEHVIPSGELTAVARVGRGRVRFTSEARTSFVQEDFRGDYDDRVGGYRYMTKVMASRQVGYALRNDVGLRFPGINLDIGQESRFRTITATHDATHFNVELSQAWRYNSDVHAGYLAAQRSIGELRASAGLRAEAERTDIQLDATTTRTEIRFFPNIGGEWTDAQRALVYRLAYGRRCRCSRPTR